MTPIPRVVAAAITLVLAAASLARPAAAASRIVSLAPSVTETLFALGAGNDVVGVSQYDDYPPAVRNLPRVGSFLTPNIEAIAALRPTLVIGLGISSNQREFRALRAMGYPTLMVEDDSLGQIEQSIRLIGERIGRTAAADQAVERIEASIAAVRRRLSGVPERRVLMLVGHQPMIAVGAGNFLDDLLKIARAENIGARLGEGWVQVSLEYIIAMRPEVILDGEMGNDPTTPIHYWDAYPIIPAVSEHHVYGYPQDPTLHPGPRAGQTLEMLAALIHPQAWKNSAAAQGARRDDSR